MQLWELDPTLNLEGNATPLRSELSSRRGSLA
jgi:hypothetical protein